MKNIRSSVDSIRVVSDSEKATKISGYANKFGLVDSYGTRFDPKTVRLDRYKKNPILLFNHDMNKVCGTVKEIEVREDGLYVVEAVIANTEHGDVPYVRDLVREGCLKSFSIRFGGSDITFEDDPDNKNGLLIKNYDIEEISIVAIPAQPESLFSVRLANEIFSQARSLNQAREMIKMIRGVKAAAYMNECLTAMTKEGMEKDELLQKVANTASIEVPELLQILEGESGSISETVLDAAVEFLGCDKEKLFALNAEDAEVELKAKRELDIAMQECVAAKIPILIDEGKSQEEAAAIAIEMCSKENGCKSSDMSDEQLQRLLETANTELEKKRQATMEEETKPIEPVERNENELLQKLDSLTALLSSLVEEVKKITDTTKSNQKIIDNNVKDKTEDDVEEEFKKLSDSEKEELEKMFKELESRLQNLQ